MKKNNLTLEKLRKKMIKLILETSYNSGQASHIGGALSIVDIMAVLYQKILSINLKKPQDRFILSKGHGFLGLLSILYCKNYINDGFLMEETKEERERNIKANEKLIIDVSKQQKELFKLFNKFTNKET